MPPIIPLVVYHGAERWEGPFRFSSLLEADETLLADLLDFPFTLVDLGSIPDRELSREAKLRLGFLLLKHGPLGTDPRMLLDEESSAALRGDADFFRLAMHYMFKALGVVDRAVVLDVVARVHPGEEEAVVSNWADELVNEGKRLGWAEGLAEGEAKGEAKGKAEFLLKLLQRRFGAVSEPWRQMVLKADTAQLEAWGEAIFDTGSLEALLGGPKPH